MTLRNIRVEPSLGDGNWTQVREVVNGLDRCVALFEKKEDAELFAAALLMWSLSQPLTPQERADLQSYYAATTHELSC